MVIAESGADSYDPCRPPAVDSSPGSESDDEHSLHAPDVSGEHASQLHPHHEEYAEYLNRRNKKRDSLSIAGIDSSDDEDSPGTGDGQRIVNVRGRVSGQVANASAVAEILDDVSPAPERENLGAVCDAAGDGAPDTRVQGAACATRPGDSGLLEDTVSPTAAVDAVNDKPPALGRPKLGYVRVRGGG